MYGLMAQDKGYRATVCGLMAQDKGYRATVYGLMAQDKGYRATVYGLMAQDKGYRATVCGLMDEISEFFIYGELCHIEGSSKPEPPAKISFQETKKILKNSTNKAWKNRINIKYLKDNIHDLLKNFQTTIFRLRRGHCRLNAHMHRLKIGSTPLCDCGYSPQTPEHVLMSCSRTERLRRSIWPTETTLEEKL